MDTIMLVSDRTVDFSNFIKPLELKYSVDVMRYISTARYKLLKSYEEYILIITEIQIITLGQFSLKETSDGAITGIIWYKKELASLGIPVLFWSCEDQNYEFEIEKLKKKYPNNKIGFIKRDNFEESHLLNGVKKFLI